MNHISLYSSAIARTLGLAAFLLVFVSIAADFSYVIVGHDFLHAFVYLFSVDSERNIPTYFTVLLMLFTALLLALIVIHKWKQKSPHVSKWAVLSFGFLIMSFDEAFQMHEMLVVPVRTLFGDSSLGVFYFAWVIPAIALLLFLGLFFLRFLLDLPAKEKFRFIVAATLYLGGAVGVELIGGHYFELHEVKDLSYVMITTVEESLEMAGLIFYIWALLNYCADNYKEVVFQFKD